MGRRVRRCPKSQKDDSGDRRMSTQLEGSLPREACTRCHRGDARWGGRGGGWYYGTHVHVKALGKEKERTLWACLLRRGPRLLFGSIVAGDADTC